MLRPSINKGWLRFDPMVALLTIPIALFLIIVQLETPKANIPQAVGPEVMPIAVLVLLMVNGVFLFIRSTSAKKKQASSVGADPSGPSPQADQQKYRGVILVLLGLIVYGFVLVPAGFILATAFLIIFEARVLQPGRWVRNVVVGVGFSTLVYFTFVKLLSVMLPAGILG
jgi:hypothetical protein